MTNCKHETVKIKLTSWDYKPEERVSVKVECWYDRSRRHWVLYPVDAEGNQLEEARYGFGKAEAMEIKKDMEAELGKVY